MTPDHTGERLTALETWIAGHEKLCAERYGSLRGDLKWILRGIFGLLAAVAAWLAIQLWTTSQARIAALERQGPPELHAALASPT